MEIFYLSSLDQSYYSLDLMRKWIQNDQGNKINLIIFLDWIEMNKITQQYLHLRAFQMFAKIYLATTKIIGETD